MISNILPVITYFPIPICQQLYRLLPSLDGSSLSCFLYLVLHDYTCLKFCAWVYTCSHFFLSSMNLQLWMLPNKFRKFIMVFFQPEGRQEQIMVSCGTCENTVAIEPRTFIRNLQGNKMASRNVFVYIYPIEVNQQRKINKFRNVLRRIHSLSRGLLDYPCSTSMRAHCQR